MLLLIKLITYKKLNKILKAAQCGLKGDEGLLNEVNIYPLTNYY